MATATEENGYTSEALDDLITTLPGLDESEKIDFLHFSGYLGIGEGREVHYWFAENEDPENTPLFIWTNGKEYILRVVPYVVHTHD